MRTNIIIDDALMKKAINVSGAKTKKEAVENGLKLLINVAAQNQITAYKGKLAWEGNLMNMRKD